MLRYGRFTQSAYLSTYLPDYLLTSSYIVLISLEQCSLEFQCVTKLVNNMINQQLWLIMKRKIIQLQNGAETNFEYRTEFSKSSLAQIS